MRRSRAIITLLLTFLFFGCIGTKELIREKMVSSKSDVFSEVSETQPLGDLSGLSIRAEIKKYPKRHYPWQEMKMSASEQQFRYLLNIGGQAAIWDIRGTLEDTPYYDKEGHHSPDAGRGIRYSLEKGLSLSAGNYKVFFALPSEDIMTQCEITVLPGHQYLLIYKPVYNRDEMDTESYRVGIREYEVLFNGIRMK